MIPRTFADANNENVLFATRWAASDNTFCLFTARRVVNNDSLYFVHVKTQLDVLSSISNLDTLFHDWVYLYYMLKFF